MAQATTQAEQLAREYAERWNDHDIEGLQDIVAESFVHENPVAPGGAVRGPDELDAFMDQITSAFPDFSVSIVDILAIEDTAMVEAEFSMTHEGELQGIPPTGNEVETASMAKFTVEDGELTAVTEYFDSKAFLEQLEGGD